MLLLIAVLAILFSLGVAQMYNALERQADQQRDKDWETHVDRCSEENLDFFETIDTWQGYELEYWQKESLADEYASNSKWSDEHNKCLIRKR